MISSVCSGGQTTVALPQLVVLKHHRERERAFEEHRISGPDEKTMRGEEVVKIIGAEALADRQARDAGVVVVGALACKRIPMICLSMKLSALPVVFRALASCMAGNWISVFMYRRPLCCILSEVFRLESELSVIRMKFLFRPGGLLRSLS